MKQNKKPKQKKIELQILYKPDEVTAMEKQFESIQQSWKDYKPTFEMTDSITEKDRVYGSLLGLAYGDVLGCPTEGMKWYQIREVFGTETVPSERPIYDPEIIAQRKYYTAFPTSIPPLPLLFKVGGLKFLRKCRPLGLHSDDTQQALALIHCCMNMQGLREGKIKFDVNAWKDYVVDGWIYSAWRGIGKNFTESSKRLYLGEATAKSSGADSAGIGACMRIGPIGALFRHLTPDWIAQIVYPSTLMTHGTIPAASVAYATALTVYFFCRNEPLESIKKLLPQLVRKAEQECYEGYSDYTFFRTKESAHVVSDTLAKMIEFMDSNASMELAALIYALRQQLGEMAKANADNVQSNKKVFAYHANQGLALLGGVHAIIMSLLPDACYIGGNPQAILLDIVQIGYDTDTVAAIAGSILGARFGAQWIPANYLLDKDNLIKYCECLYEDVPLPEKRKDLLKRESIMTVIEKAFQKKMKTAKFDKPVVQAKESDDDEDQ